MSRARKFPQRIQSCDDTRSIYYAWHHERRRMNHLWKATDAGHPGAQLQASYIQLLKQRWRRHTIRR